MTHEELQDLLNTDLAQPHPDPEWDYYSLWENLHKIKSEVTSILEFIAPLENATAETDSSVRQKIITLLDSVKNLAETV